MSARAGALSLYVSWVVGGEGEDPLSVAWPGWSGQHRSRRRLLAGLFLMLLVTGCGVVAEVGPTTPESTEPSVSAPEVPVVAFEAVPTVVELTHGLPRTGALPAPGAGTPSDTVSP